MELKRSWKSALILVTIILVSFFAGMVAFTVLQFNLPMFFPNQSKIAAFEISANEIYEASDEQKIVHSCEVAAFKIFGIAKPTADYFLVCDGHRTVREVENNVVFLGYCTCAIINGDAPKIRLPWNYTG